MKTKPQGKINPKIVAEGLLNGEKKKDIAVKAGSLAKTDRAKGKAVTQVVQSSAFQKLAKKALSDNSLLKVHKQGLGAYKEETRKVGGRNKIVKVPDFNARHKYMETGYEVRKLIDKSSKPGDTVNIFNASKMLINAPR